MKIIVIVIFLLLGLNRTFSQNEREVCPLLQQAAKSYCEGRYPQTIKTLNTFLKKFPDHLLTQEAMYARGLSAFKAKKIKLAERYLKEVMNLRTYNESDSFGYSILLCNYIYEKCNNILIPDYLQNLQHEASILLYEIEMRKKNYSSAFTHLDNAARYYRFWYGCGTTDLDESIRLALLFSNYYDITNKPDSAIDVLLPYLFEPAAFPMKNYESLCKTAAEKLIKQKGETQVKAELFNAVRNVYHESHSDFYGHESRVWFVSFYGSKIKASPEYLHSKTTNPDEVQQYLMQTPFYKMIFNLP